MGHASKGFLILRPVHAADRRLLPFGNPAFRMWPLGPSCFDGIRTRIATDDASYLWKAKPCCGYDAGKAVLFRPLRCKVRALTIVPLRPNMAAGGWRR